MKGTWDIERIIGPILFHPRWPPSGIPVTWWKSDSLCFSVISETMMKLRFEPKPNPCSWLPHSAESLLTHMKGMLFLNSHYQWPGKTGKILLLGAPVMAQQDWKHLGSPGIQVPSPAQHSGLMTPRNCSLGHDCSSDLWSLAWELLGGQIWKRKKKKNPAPTLLP